jgi:hypothetical protein
VDGQPGASTVKVDSQNNPDIASLEWTVHGLRDNPRGISLVVAGYCGAVLLWQILFPHWPALVLLLISMTSALSDFLWPIRYRVAADGIQANCGPFQRLHLSWREIRRIQRGRDGVYVTSLKVPSRLDQFRGIRLRFGSMDPEVVVAAVVTGRDTACASAAQEVPSVG